MKPRHGLLIAALAAVVLVVLLAVPFLIDTGRYKEILLPRLEAALGRKVTVKGPIAFSLLPMPSFSFEQVSLGDQVGRAPADKPTDKMVSFADLSRLKLYLRPWPLLLGRAEVASITLTDPDIRLTLQGAGPAAADKPAGPPGLPPAPEAAALLSGLPDIDRVTVRNGALTLVWPSHDPLRIETIDADLDNRGGDLTAKGSARADGVDFSFDGGLGRNAPSIPLSLALTSAAGGAKARLSGTIERGAPRPFKGKLTASLADLPLFAKQFGEAASGLAWPAGKFSLDAQLSGSGSELFADQLALEISGADGRGSAQLALADLPQADLKLTFNRLDLDGLMAAAGRSAAKSASRAADIAGGGPAPQPQPSAQPGLPAAGEGSFVLPKGVAVNLDLSAAAVIAGGGLVKGAHLNAALANGVLVLNQASLALPGNTDFNLFGILAAEGGAPVFDGSFEAAIGDLPGLAAWLKADLPTLAPGRLQSARLAGKLKARPGEIALEEAQARIDGSSLQAAATLHLGPRPAIGLSFAIDGFNADAYRPLAVPPKPDAGRDLPAKGGAAKPATAWLPAWTAGIDANIQGRVGQLVVAGGNAQGVSLNAGWHDGHLDLADFSVADFAGAQLQLAGRVDGLASAKPALQTLRFGLKVRQPGHLLGQLGQLPPVDLDQLGPLSAAGTLSGDAADLTVDGRAEAAGASLTVAGHVRGLDRAPLYDVDLAASHAAWGQLVRIVAPDYHPAGGQGAFAASTHLSGGRGDLSLSDFRLKLGSLSAAGAAHLTGRGRHRLELTLAAGELAVDPLLQSLRKGDAGLHEMIHTGLLVPSRGPKPGVAQATPDRVGGGDSLDRITAAPRAAVVTSAIPERFAGDALDLGWLAGFDGAFHLQAQAVTYGRARIEQAGLEAVLADGRLQISQLSGQLYGGRLDGQGQLDAKGALSAKLALSHGRMKDALLGIADLDIADGVMDANADITAAGRSSAEMMAHLAGSGSFTVSDGVLRGFDLAAVNQRLESHAAGAAGLVTLLQAGVNGGKTAFSRFTGTIKANNGLLVVDNLSLTADGGSAKGRADVNLSAAVMDAHADFRLASAASAPPLVMRLSGPLAAPRRTMEINPLQTWLAQTYKAPEPPAAKKPPVKKGRR